MRMKTAKPQMFDLRKEFSDIPKHESEESGGVGDHEETGPVVGKVSSCFAGGKLVEEGGDDDPGDIRHDGHREDGRQQQESLPPGSRHEHQVGVGQCQDTDEDAHARAGFFDEKSVFAKEDHVAFVKSGETKKLQRPAAQSRGDLLERYAEPRFHAEREGHHEEEEDDGRECPPEHPSPEQQPGGSSRPDDDRPAIDGGKEEGSTGDSHRNAGDEEHQSTPVEARLEFGHRGAPEIEERDGQRNDQVAVRVVRFLVPRSDEFPKGGQIGEDERREDGGDDGQPLDAGNRWCGFRGGRSHLVRGKCVGGNLDAGVRPGRKVDRLEGGGQRAKQHCLSFESGWWGRARTGMELLAASSPTGPFLISRTTNSR